MFFDDDVIVTKQEMVVDEDGNPMIIGPVTTIEFVSAPEPEVSSELDQVIESVIESNDVEDQFERVEIEDPFAELLREIEAQMTESVVPPPDLIKQLGNIEIVDDSDEEQAVEVANELESVSAEESANEPITTLEQIVAASQEAAELEPESSEAIDELSEEPEAEEVAEVRGYDDKLLIARKALLQARDMLSSVIELLDAEARNGGAAPQSLGTTLKQALRSVGARVMEGVFDGERMISGDGGMFPVPPNYASKSKLVEGDMLKLTVMPDGKMIYKQIGPTSRERVKGILSCDERGGYCVHASGSRFKILPASVSFFKGRPGDHVIALVPKGSPSRYAAVDFIVHQ